MKKIMSDKSFWIILIISIITLVGLTVGVIFLTRKNTKEFYSAGYIINSTTTKTDKYYFDDNTVYKENVFNEYVFTDVDDKEVTTSKDNFIHYLDNSLSFMKNGVILDLDNFNENIVPYYNITDKSIVQYNNGGYYIETSDKTLVFGNFLGRITDNKYIVVGDDISVKLAGNDTPVKGDYFEILFIEDGIVKIENQEGSYQTISEGTVIYIGDNIKINLGDKSVNYGEDVKLNLSELTIDGNENIDIVPEEGLVDNSEGIDGSDSGTGTNDEKIPEEGSGNDSGNDTGEVTDDGSDVDGDTTTVLKKEVAVNLIEASSTVNSITAKFQVIDTMEAIKGNLVLTLVNTTTGKTVYTKVLANTPEEQPIYITSLDSECNYIMTIVDETNEISTQYFQKSFRTDSLNLRLKREFVTETSLTYSLDFGTKSDVAKADVSIYTEDNEFIERQTIEKDTNDSVTFDGLTNNTLYVVKVDRVYVKNVLEERYSSTTSDLTLKKKPVLGSVSVDTSNDAKIFTLKIDSDSIFDDDNAIVKYTYQIFESVKDEDETEKLELVYSFVRDDISDEILKIGQKIDGEKELKLNTDYKFKIVAQYYDNYRYNEIETGLSEDFNVVGLPTISFEPDEITINKISGTVIIEDEGCTVSFEDRQCNNNPNNIYIQYYDGTTMIKSNVEIKDEDITVDEVSNKLSLYFEVTGLQQNTPHIFDVYADVDLKNGNGVIKDKHLGSFTIWTEGIDSLKIQKWKDNDYSFENPISVNAEMISMIAESDSINTLRSLTFNLYGGDASNYIGKNAVPIASYTVTGNIKEQFYDNDKKLVSFNINSSMFEYGDKEKFKISDLNVLKELSGGSLYEKYTIEITDAYDEGEANKFVIVDNIYVYTTPSMLLLEDEVTTNIIVDEITNEMTKSGNYDVSYIDDKNVDNDLIRGYTVTADFDDKKIKDIVGSNSISKINFYAYDRSGRVVEQKTIDFNETEEKTVHFYLGDGTEYNVKDTVGLIRGNSYTFAYDLSIDHDGNPNNDEQTYPSDKAISERFNAEKQVPKIKYYIDNSTETSITYKYQVFDYDKALYGEEDKYYIYYNVNGSEDYKVEYITDNSIGTFTLSNLSNGAIYNFGYYSAISKQYQPERNDVGSYYFDGLYNLEDELKYTLHSSNDSNYLNIVIEDNEFTNRVSSYLLTLTVEGVEQKYQKVISNLSKCDDKQCIILNYKDLKVKNGDAEISFKGKDVTVELTAFYDTGYIGFSQETKLGNYFKNLGLVSEEDASKVGFVYQTNSVNEAGKYFYVRSGNYVLDGSNIELFDYPRGILGFELDNSNFDAAYWYLNSSNLIDEANNLFTSFGKIAYNNSKVELDDSLGGIVIKDKAVTSTSVTINPKVLDKVEINPTKDNTFKFTSIIPNVSAKYSDRLINGATIDITLNVDDDLLKSDYCATDEDNLDSDVCGHKGKYNVYINLYQKDICPETGEYTDKFDNGTCVPGELYDKYVKTVTTDVDHLTGVSFIGLLPDTEYTYTLSADMNKNGRKVETLLFDEAGKVFKGKFSTLNKNEIFTNVSYYHSSSITDISYSTRKLSLTTDLKNKTNYNLVYKLFDINGEPEFGDEGVIILNESITQDGNKFTASYVHDITGNDFVFGSNYYELVITAVTTDLEAPLELYRGMLNNEVKDNHLFRQLDSIHNDNSNPNNFVIGIEYPEVGTNDVISQIIVKDVDKVIKDGTFYVRLQDTNEKNLLVCKDGDIECEQACEAIYNADQEEEALANPCRLTVKIGVNDAGKIAASCDNDKYTNIESCEFMISNSNEYGIEVKFKDLKADNFYSIFVHADTYSKNFDNGKFIEPEGVATARKNQYTKSSLGFSLGSVTPTYSINNNKLTITYVDSANLTDSLYGMEYTITERGGSKVMNGVLGDTVITDKPLTGNNLSFTSSSNPRIDIPLDGKTLSKNTTYYITITYYYKDSDDGTLKLLEFGDKTNQVYTIEVS